MAFIDDAPPPPEKRIRAHVIHMCVVICGRSQSLESPGAFDLIVIASMNAAGGEAFLERGERQVHW